MKNQSMKMLMLSVLMLIGSTTFAQKKNVQNAVMDYSAYEKALMNKNMSGAKKSILSAKTNIDEAAVNAETAQDIKMFFYKGKIYMGLAAVAMMMEEDEEMKAFASESTMKTGIDAWKTCYEIDTKAKYRDDIKGQVMMIAYQGNVMGGTMFGEQKFQEAYELFSSSVTMYDIVGGLEVKEYGASAFNAGLSAERIEKHDEAFKFFSLAEKAGFEPSASSAKAANALYGSGKSDEAMAFVVAASQKYPGDGGLIITMADLALKTGQDDLAIKSLNQAIEKDPRNGIYHWAVGTVYQRMNKEEEAMKSFLKASELSPKDERPFYSLGTFHFNKAVDLMDQANKLKLNDPNFNVLEKQATEEFGKSAPYLEKVVEIKGDAGNKDLLMNLFTIYRKLGDNTKALDFKKRADALK